MIIEIYNSYSKLVDADKESVKAVDEALTYEDKEIFFQLQSLNRQLIKAEAYRSKKWAAKIKKDMEDLGSSTVKLLQNNTFPTGLLDLVESTLKAPYKLVDKRIEPSPSLSLRWRNKPPKMRYYQSEMVGIADTEPRGIFESATGSGKSLTLLNIIKQKSVPTLIIVPSTALVEQMLDMLRLYFDSKHSCHLTTKLISGSKKLAPLRVATMATLHSMNKKGTLDKALKDIDMFIWDEAHHSGSSTGVALLKKMEHIYYRYSLSATYLRNDSRELQLKGILAKKLYEYPAHKATSEGYLVPIHYKIYDLPGIDIKNYKKEYDANYQENKKFFDKIVEIVRSINKEEQILILVERKDAVGKVLYETLKKHKIDCTYRSGDNKAKDVNQSIKDFNDKKIRVLIASQILGEGCDLQSTEHLIFARGGKSEIAVTQAFGRATRLYPGKEKSYIYDFRFEPTSYIGKHCDERIGIFKRGFDGQVEYVKN